MAIEYLKSESVSFNHAYFARTGGVSKGKYASLNVTTRVGDTPEAVSENISLALSAIHLDPKKLAFLDAMPHKTKVLAVTKKAHGLKFNDYDIIMTNVPDLPIAMAVADCAAVLLADEAKGVIALAHSGWRGTKARAVEVAVEAMVLEYGSKPSDISAVVGPSISPDVYEVGKEVAKQFNSRYLLKRGDKTFLDLWLAIEDQLQELNLKSVDNLKVDTYSDDRFFSYRQDDGDTGRFLCIASL